MNSLKTLRASVEAAQVLVREARASREEAARAYVKALNVIGTIVCKSGRNLYVNGFVVDSYGARLVATPLNAKGKIDARCATGSERLYIEELKRVSPDGEPVDPDAHAEWVAQMRSDFQS